MADGSAGDEAIVRIAADIAELKKGVSDAVNEMRSLKPRIEEITKATKETGEATHKAAEQMESFGRSMEHHLKHQMYHILIHLITEKVKELAEGFKEAEERGASFWQSLQEGIAKAAGFRTVTEAIKEMHEAIKKSKESLDELRDSYAEWMRQQGFQGRQDIGGYEYELTDNPEDVGLSEEARKRIRQIKKDIRKRSDEMQETQNKIASDESEKAMGSEKTQWWEYTIPIYHGIRRGIESQQATQKLEKDTKTLGEQKADQADAEKMIKEIRERDVGEKQAPGIESGESIYERITGAAAVDERLTVKQAVDDAAAQAHDDAVAIKDAINGTGANPPGLAMPDTTAYPPGYFKPMEIPASGGIDTSNGLQGLLSGLFSMLP